MSSGEAYVLCFVLYVVSVSGFSTYISDVSLLNKKGEDTCTYFEHVGLCFVSPNEEVTLRFNLFVDDNVSNQKLEVYFNGVLLLTQYLCYDPRSGKVSTSPDISSKSSDECTIPNSSSTYNVEILFSLPQFQGSGELYFHFGEADGILVVLSGSQPLPPPPPPTEASPTPLPTTTEGPDDDTNHSYGQYGNGDSHLDSDNPPGQ